MSRTLIDASLIAPFANTFIGLGRNRAINGEMRIDQANGGAARTYNDTSFPPSVDMWKGSATAASGVFTLQRSTSTPPTGFTNFLRATCTTADASITANDGYLVHSYIEGNNVRDFLIGTANAKTVTLSFWVRSTLTGIYGVALANGAFDRNYVAEYTINVASTWEFKSVTIILDTSGTWLTDSGIGLALRWTLAAGSSSQTPAGIWTPGNLVTTSNQVNFMSSNSSRTWDITGVQIEIGSVSTGYEYRPFQTELFLCQRYYETSENDVSPVTSHNMVIVPGTQIGTTTTSYTWSFKVRKRIAPTVTVWDDGGNAGQWLCKSASGANTRRAMSSNGTWVDGFAMFQASAFEPLALQSSWAADARL